MNIAITGASGFIGTRLSARLTGAGHAVRALERTYAVTELDDCDAVVHLAGEPVAQRWTSAAKARIRDSRVQGTRRLVGALGSERRPKILVSASAIGYYGDRGDEVLIESSAPGQGFLPEVCVEWEREALAARERGVRTAVIRTGLVLGPDGGALAKMVTPFRYGLGGRLGSGQQWMSWVHLDDLCALYEMAISLPLEGPLNGASPNPVRNADFTAALGRTLHRPAILPVPRFAVELLFGEMAQILFSSQRVMPRATEASGFRFHYDDVAGALRHVLL